MIPPEPLQRGLESSGWNLVVGIWWRRQSKAAGEDPSSASAEGVGKVTIPVNPTLGFGQVCLNFGLSGAFCLNGGGFFA